MDLINGMPYTNFHELNMDWIIKVVKNFLDQYTHLQETIENGLVSLDEKTTAGLTALDEKAETLQSLLQAWYDTHSEDIATQLASALADMNQLLATNQTLFDTHADAKAAQTIQTIPADYSEFYGIAMKVLESINGTGTIDCNDLADNSIQPFNLNATIIHGPVENFTPTNGGTWFIDTYVTDFRGEPLKVQAIRKNDLSIYATRNYVMSVHSDWQPWVYRNLDIHRTNSNYNGDGTINCNTLENNTLQLFNRNVILVNGPSNLPALGDSTWAIETVTTSFRDDAYIIQTIYNILNRTDWYATRVKVASVSPNWGSWTIKYGTQQAIIHVGPGQTYTRLRDGVEAALLQRGSVVYVHAGTYDLTAEFATEIQAASYSGDVGVALGNDVTLIFYDGAKVTALFDNSSGQYTETQWTFIRENFAPFHTIRQYENNYTIHNLNIEASNCRYCVHDELWGEYTGIHKYFNCRMKNTYTREYVPYPQCIGSGMGVHSTIVIEGGYYLSQYPSGMVKPTISFHNGTPVTCDGSISISNVYIAQDGFIQLGCYGTSPIKTPAMVSGCHMGYPVRKKMETPDSHTDNFEIIAWNNDITNDRPWDD